MKSVVIGTIFEQLFYRAAISHKMGILRLPDACKVVGKNKLIRVKSPCDFVLMNNGKAAFIDTKTQGSGATFPKANINIHQVLSINFMVSNGAKGGYVCWYRELDVVIFYDSETLRTAEEGLGIGMGINLGSMDDIDLGKIFE